MGQNEAQLGHTEEPVETPAPREVSSEEARTRLCSKVKVCFDRLLRSMCKEKVRKNGGDVRSIIEDDIADTGGMLHPSIGNILIAAKHGNVDSEFLENLRRWSIIIGFSLDDENLLQLEAEFGAYEVTSEVKTEVCATAK